MSTSVQQINEKLNMIITQEEVVTAGQQDKYLDVRPDIEPGWEISQITYLFEAQKCSTPSPLFKNAKWIPSIHYTNRLPRHQSIT